MGYCSHVCKLDLQYWKKDDSVQWIDEVVISLVDTVSSSSESDDKSESDDGNDNDLDQPLPTEPSRHCLA
jgi:hypothetical protein